MRRHVVRALRGLHAVSVENAVGTGMPDVNYADGWLELKSVARWPTRPSSPLRVPHFTQEQRLWIRRRQEAGGRVHVLLKVEREWLLFDGIFAADHLGYSTYDKLVWKAKAFWERAPSPESLQRNLCSKRT